MSDINGWDVAFAVGPFLILGAIGAWTWRRQRRCLVCHSHHRNIALRQRHEHLTHGLR